MKIVELTCSSCGEIFQKAKKEFDRQTRNGREEFFCTRSCSGKHSIDQKLGDYKGNMNNIPDKYKHGYDRSDEYTPFKFLLRRVKDRYSAKGKEYDIDLPYLKEIWENQNSKCKVTGVNLILEDGVTNPNYSASLDRIDSDIGYMKGNVQFISVTANHAKNKYSEEILQEFFQIVRAA